MEKENLDELTKLEKEFKDLKKRIRSTRKSRIEASKRLRRKNSFYEKVTHFYSLVVLILSVWFLNQSGDSGQLAGKVLLVLSLSLTYFTMFLSLRNYKERAGNFESNYQQLDVLINKIDRLFASEKELTLETLKGYQREYEKLIIGNENHQNIDYYMCDKEKYKLEIMLHNRKESLVNICIAVYPFLLLAAVYLFTKVIDLIKLF
jgi:ABC-type transport system involved in cytochrome bd biosynthesis fused ATPase/permease subunit